MMRLVYLGLCLVVLVGCEGTWATPNQVTLEPNGTHINGIVTVSVANERIGSNEAVGSNIDVQVPSLRDARPYTVVLQRGSCNSGTSIENFKVFEYPDPGEGLGSGGHVDIPIHHLMKDGYDVALLDKRRHRIVACANLQTDRPF